MHLRHYGVTQLDYFISTPLSLGRLVESPYYRRGLAGTENEMMSLSLLDLSVQDYP